MDRTSQSSRPNWIKIIRWSSTSAVGRHKAKTGPIYYLRNSQEPKHTKLLTLRLNCGYNASLCWMRHRMSCSKQRMKSRGASGMITCGRGSVLSRKTTTLQYSAISLRRMSMCLSGSVKWRWKWVKSSELNSSSLSSRTRKRITKAGSSQEGKWIATSLVKTSWRTPPATKTWWWMAVESSKPSNKSTHKTR